MFDKIALKGVVKMNKLKTLRKEKGLSQQALGKAIGVSYRTVQNWENGVNQIKPDKAEMLADYFDVPIGYLLGYETILDIKKDFLGTSLSWEEYNIAKKDSELMKKIDFKNKYNDVTEYGLEFSLHLFGYQADKFADLIFGLQSYYVDKIENNTLSEKDIKLANELVEQIETERLFLHDTLLQAREVIDRLVTKHRDK